MRKLVVTIAILSGLSIGASLMPAEAGTLGQGLGRAADAIDPIQSAGCYRLGETGYHWYRFCAGPRWLYPHRRYCRAGQCVYR
ncbi:MAG TPA: hypothetical protein VF913_11445 [Xanthobacteraceae bacterium]